MLKKTIEGIVDVDSVQKSDGDNINITRVLDITSGKDILFDLLSEFDQEKVKITVEKISK
jgi:hypothetical protein